jgi:hypothetical protein
MAKTNISFNNKNYQIDEASLSTATAALKSHLSTVMNGTGAVINLGGVAYSIDAAKLSATTNAFVQHLGTIAGSGHKVMIDGVEYGIDSTKLTSAISDIEAVLAGTGEERLEGDGAEYYTLAPTALSFRSTAPLNELQEIQINGVTVDPANYTLEEGSTIVTFPIDYLKTLNVGNYEVTVASDSKSVKGGFTVAAPELNEHGFYYNQPYTAYMDYFSSDIVMFIRTDNIVDIMVIRHGVIETATYVVNGGTLIITSPSMGELHCTFSESGMELYNAEFDATLKLGENTAYAADEDYIYIYREDFGDYEVKCISKTKTEYDAIRTNVHGINTTTIGESAFSNCSNLVSITIPDNITSIGVSAFYGCESLTNITIPNSVTNIGTAAFDGCTGLTSVVIGNSVTSIGNYAFRNCTSLASVIFGENTELTVIGDQSFMNCKNLANIKIPNTVTSIIQFAFADCTSLASVILPASVTSIGSLVFRGCTSLIDVIFEGTIEEWNAISKTDDWHTNVPATYVQCSDGQVAL